MEKGILYLVATPIGNLEDITYRAVRILKEVDYIAAEDTRRTRKLLTYYEIHTRLIRYDEHTKKENGEKIIKLLNEGKKIACVSDAGIPAISDPGFDLVKLAVESEIKVSPIPGANAGLSALICSAIDTSRFTFIGFLPKTLKKRKEIIKELTKMRETIIIYETPHHMKKTLKELQEEIGNREAVIGREITKIHEEFLRGNLTELIEKITEEKGEYVIVLEGKKFEEVETCEEDFIEEYKKLIKGGVEKKIAIKEVAKKNNISRREVYNAVINL